MKPTGLVATRLSSVTLLLALVACGGSPGETSGAESGSETLATADVGGSAADSRAPSGSSTPASVESLDTGREVMAGIITAPVARTDGEAPAEDSDDTSGVDAPGGAGDTPTSSMQPWEQKRAALLDIIGRPLVPLDAMETALPDDAGLTVRDFSIATDESTRINGTSFAPQREGPLPAVIFLHGTGGSRRDGFGLLRTLAQEGFFALAIDARHHGPGIGQNPYFDAITRPTSPGRGIRSYTTPSGT